MVLIACLALLSGCAQTVKQHANMLNAMNGKLTPINYTRTYIFSTFGYPDSMTSSKTDNVRKDVWTYKTNLGDENLAFNIHSYKTRYMKITMVNNIVTDVAFDKEK